MTIKRHSVILDEERCRGCTHCMRRCPTEAIRVYDGKAHIIEERCIDCGECIRRCPYLAKKAKYDPFEKRKKFKYTIGLPAPSLYGQFHNMNDINMILTALKRIGFDDVVEVAEAAEVISQFTNEMIKAGELHTPVISSACPAIARLIRVQFPQLCNQVLPIISPMQLAAKMARERAMLHHGLSSTDIGVFFISPCPAKVTEARQPIGIQQGWVDGAFSISELYPLLVEELPKLGEEDIEKLAVASNLGIGWANSGGEAAGLFVERYLDADGMENVISVLEELEEDRFRDLDFIELNACPGGCVGGVLTVENPYVAKARVQSLVRKDPVLPAEKTVGKEPIPPHVAHQILWKKPLTDAGIIRLSEDIGESLAMMAEIEKIRAVIPDLDCGSCGAPTCQAMAEDIVKGHGSLSDCIFTLGQTELEEEELGFVKINKEELGT